MGFGGEADDLKSSLSALMMMVDSKLKNNILIPYSIYFPF